MNWDGAWISTTLIGFEDQQQRAESLRTRGGQVAGFGAAVLALIGGNATELLTALGEWPGALVGAALVAAVLLLAGAVIIAIWGVLRPKIYPAISAGEIAIYATERFLTEPELWRVHVRSLRILTHATANAQEAGDSAEKAIEWSLRAFLGGLAFCSLAISTLLVELI